MSIKYKLKQNLAQTNNENTKFENNHPNVDNFDTKIDHQNELINTYLNDMIALKDQLNKEKNMNDKLKKSNDNLQFKVKEHEQTIDKQKKELEFNHKINYQIYDLIKQKQVIKSQLNEFIKEKNKYNLKLGELLREKNKLNLQISELLKEKKLNESLNKDINELSKTNKDDNFVSQISKLSKNKDLSNKLNLQIYELTQTKEMVRVQINDCIKEKTNLNQQINSLVEDKQNKNNQIDELLLQKHNLDVPTSNEQNDKIFDIQLDNSLKGFKITESTKSKISRKINEILRECKLNE